MDTNKVQFQNPTGNAGLNDLVELLDFGFQFKDAVVAAKADGKISLADFPLLFSLFAPAEAAFEGIENIPANWHNATDDERRAILDYFNQKFDLTDDRTEGKIEKFLAAFVLIYEGSTL